MRSGPKYGLRISRETYAQINKRSSTRFPRELDPALWDAVDESYEDEDHRFHTDAWCLEQRARALENYDLNMAYFASLDHAEFDQVVSRAVTSRRGMREVHDLNEWDGTSGLYVMVLDNYCQVYVGVATGAGGVKDRIRRHWSSSKAFDRLLWGGVHDSILSIDSFRALDTTRIFAAKVSDPFALEERVIRAFPSGFVLNRIIGGRGDLVAFAHRLGVDINKHREFEADLVPQRGVDSQGARPVSPLGITPV
ncbi:hypothetical protein ABC195_16025 [Microbacterium sp. 2P01SA-2]|uniref:hypothetical protein n=1 Tax=unclassified Microbacterium TaxID=2609290 RepID=UPI0039A08810